MLGAVRESLQSLSWSSASSGRDASRGASQDGGANGGSPPMSPPSSARSSQSGGDEDGLTQVRFAPHAQAAALRACSSPWPDPNHDLKVNLDSTPAMSIRLVSSSFTTECQPHSQTWNLLLNTSHICSRCGP